MKVQPGDVRCATPMQCSCNERQKSMDKHPNVLFSSRIILSRNQPINTCSFVFLHFVGWLYNPPPFSVNVEFLHNIVFFFFFFLVFLPFLRPLPCIHSCGFIVFLFFILFFYFYNLFIYFSAAPSACGNSQARNWTGTTAVTWSIAVTMPGP